MDAAAAATAATLVGEGGRASSRVRKVSKALARVDDESRRQAVAARLDALEQDQAAADALGEDSDEYIAEEELDGSAPRMRKKGGKRTTRGAAAEKRGLKGLGQLLEEARLDLLLPSDPSYLKAEMGPPKCEAPRKFCSVCGFAGPYTCPRCGMRYCSRRCAGTHADTRCLRFTVY